MVTSVVMNWSSGKDAAMAYRLLSTGGRYKVRHLLTTMSEEHNRVFMHGVSEQLLDMQAQRVGLPLRKVKLPASPDDGIYKAAMQQVLGEMKGNGITAAAFGDIFLEDLRAYREAQLAQVGMDAVFPLWGKSTSDLVCMAEDAGIEAMIVCVNERCLGPEFLGRRIDRALLADLPAGVDPCGENGEYHTLVINAPFFSSPIPVAAGATVYKKYTSPDGAGWDTGFYFLEVNADI